MCTIGAISPDAHIVTVNDGETTYIKIELTPSITFYHDINHFGNDSNQFYAIMFPVSLDSKNRVISRSFCEMGRKEYDFIYPAGKYQMAFAREGVVNISVDDPNFFVLENNCRLDASWENAAVLTASRKCRSRPTPL